MRKIEQRVRFCKLILLAFVCGIILFLVRYVNQADKWYTQPFNKNLYSSSGELLTGTLTDRYGTVLSRVEDGTRYYSALPAVRKSTLHIVGDRHNKIGTGALNNLREYLVSYNSGKGASGITDDGNTVSLSISADACVTAYNALNGASGCVGVYNYRTGEILCLVSSPTYDPDNVPEDLETNEAYDGVYVNRFFYSVYTPGSVFKTLTLQAALEQIPDVTSRTFVCEGSVKVGDNTVTCPQKHGTLSLSDAYAVSCNCTFAKLAVEIGGDVMTEYVHKAGLTASYKIHGFSTAKGSFELASVSANQLGWGGVGLYHDLVNPCAVMLYYGAIANGGKAAVPTYLHSVTDAKGRSVEIPKATFTEELVTPSTASKLSVYMKNNLTVSYDKSRFPNVPIGAKSSTVEQKTGKSNSWFAGFVDSEEYPYAFVVIVEHGGSGSRVAGEIAAAVLKTLIPVP